MLGDADRTTSAIKIKSGSKKSYRSIKHVEIQCLNGILRRPSLATPGLSLNFDFSQKDVTTANSGFFCKSGRVGLLEAKDFDDVDKILFFFGAILNVYCEKVGSDVPATFNFHTDLLKVFFWMKELIRWTRSDLDEPRTRMLLHQNRSEEKIYELSAVI